MKTKNTFLFTFLHAMKKYFLLPVIIFGSLLIGHLSNIIQGYRNFMLAMENKALETGESLDSLLKYTKYIFIEVTPEGWSSGADTMLLFSIIAIIASALLGIFLFKFVTNKKTVNVYYSLGIKRTELFTARYLAGAAMILIAVSLPLLIGAVINIVWFGSSVMLWKAVFFYIFHYAVICLAAFTIAAAVSGCIGTMVESVGFTAILLAFPAAAYTCFRNICTALLHGMPTGIYLFVTIEKERNTIGVSMDKTVLGKILENINLFKLNYDSYYSMGQVLHKHSCKEWSFPSLTPYLLWITLIVAIFFIGLFMFKKRKAEICGFAGKNKLLNSVAATLISLFIISLIVMNIPNVFVLILVSLLISFAVFSIIELALTRNIKEYIKALKIAPVHAVLVILLITTLSTGFFGYSQKIPDTDKIESVRISMPISFTGYWANGNCSKYDGYNFRFSKTGNSEYYNYYYLSNNSGYFLPEAKDQESIDAIINVHKKIIDAGMLHADKNNPTRDYSKRTSPMEVTFLYKLKNGKEIIRSYDIISYDVIEDILKIEDTPVWNNFVDKTLKNRNPKDTVAVLLSKQVEKKTFIDEKLNEDLLNAISLDIRDLSYKSFWQSDSDFLGTIAIHPNYYYSVAEQPQAQPQFNDKYEPEESSPEDSIKRHWLDEGRKYEYFGIRYSEEAIFIPVAKDMKNTVKLLKENNLYDKLIDNSPVVSARYFKTVDVIPYTMDTYYESIPVFNAFWEKGDAKPYSTAYNDSQYEAGGFMPKNAKTTTDKNIIDSLLNNAYGLYLDVDGESAYIVEFTRQNGEKTIMYVPSDRVKLS